MSKILLLCFLITAFAVHAGSFYENDWSGLMQKNVSVGERDGVPLHLVDYQHIKSDPRFARVIAELKIFDPRALHLTWIIHEICSKLILGINFKTVTITC